MSLREALDNWERIGAKGPVYDAARRLLEAEEVWWCRERFNKAANTTECFNEEQRLERVGFRFGEHERCGPKLLVDPQEGESE